MKVVAIVLAAISLASASWVAYRAEYGTWDPRTTPATLFYNGHEFHDTNEVLTWDQLVADEHRASAFSQVRVVPKAQTVWGDPIFALDLPYGQGPDGGMCIGLKVGPNQYRVYMASFG